MKHFEIEWKIFNFSYMKPSCLKCEHFSITFRKSSHGGCCHHETSSNLETLLMAILAATFFLASSIMANNRKRKKRSVSAQSQEVIDKISQLASSAYEGNSKRPIIF